MNLKDFSATIDHALASAGVSTQHGAAARMSETIRNALNAAGILQVRPGDATVGRSAPRPKTGQAPSRRAALPGSFTQHTFSSGVAQRDYKLYVPSKPGGPSMPLVVMLHGCKQDPDDFARGTRMNALAEAHGFLVAYPAQTARANGSNCWNWFSPSEQARGGEEPSLIAGIARQVGEGHPVDEARVFVAGLSAGAAMAVILGDTYPEVFRAVAAHSGLAVGAAHDVASAFAAMHGRPSRTDFRGRPSRNKERFADTRSHAVRTLVLQGDADATVVASNADAVEADAVEAFGVVNDAALSVSVEQRSVGGCECIVTRHADAAGRVLVERWAVHGGAHAWFGGCPEGSYTDARGPDASEEIVRFFLER